MLWLTYVTVGYQDSYDMSDKKILAMGHDSWISWATNSNRGGDGAKVSAEKAYCIALTNQNERMLKTLNANRRNKYEKLYTLMINMSKSATNIGTSYAGGGDIWVLRSAEATTAASSALSALISLQKNELSVEQNDVWDEFRAAKENLANRKAEIEAFGQRTAGFRYQQVMSEFNSLGRLTKESFELVQNSPRSEKANVFTFARKMIRLVVHGNFD